MGATAWHSLPGEGSSSQSGTPVPLVFVFPQTEPPWGRQPQGLSTCCSCVTRSLWSLRAKRTHTSCGSRKSRRRPGVCSPGEGRDGAGWQEAPGLADCYGFGETAAHFLTGQARQTGCQGSLLSAQCAGGLTWYNGKRKEKCWAGPQKLYLLPWQPCSPAVSLGGSPKCLSGDSHVVLESSLGASHPTLTCHCQAMGRGWAGKGRVSVVPGNHK